MRVRFTEAASEDLREIGDFIAQHDPRHALSFVRELRAAAARIGDMPLAHPVVSVSRGGAIRRRIRAASLPFDVVGESAVDVVCVLHGARDVDAVLDRRSRWSS